MPISQSGYAYRFSPQSLGQPEEEPVQAQQDIFDLPLSQELANVRGLTENYYNSYGRIKDFVNHAWKNYGVDVTKPNFASPGGGDLYKAYQNMEAELMMTANDLKSFKEQEAERAKQYQLGNYRYNTGYDPNSPESVYMTPQQIGYNTELVPHVSEAIKRLSVMYNSEGKATEATEKYRKNAENQIDQMVSQGMISPEQADFNKKALFNAMGQTPYQVDVAAMKEQQRRQKIVGDAESVYRAGKKFNSDMSGLWSPERVEYKTIDGKTVAVMRPETSLSFGQEDVDVDGKIKTLEKTLDYYYKDANGRVFAKFTQPKYFKDERVDNKSADEKVRIAYSNNPKIGDAAKWSQNMEILRNEYGSIDQSQMYTQEEMDSLNKNVEEVDRRLNERDKSLQYERTKIANLAKEGVKNMNYRLKGRDVFFKRHFSGGKYYLEPADYKFITGEKGTKADYEQLTPERILDLIEKAGMFETTVNPKTETPQATEPTLPVGESGIQWGKPK